MQQDSEDVSSQVSRARETQYGLAGGTRCSGAPFNLLAAKGPELRRGRNACKIVASYPRSRTSH